MRIKVGLLALVAAIGSLFVFAITTSATAAVVTSAPDPQTSNIPYLAWNGEEVRLAKCYRASDIGSDNLTTVVTNPNRLSVSFRVLGWTGSPAPFNTSDNVESNTQAIYTNRGAICARGDVVSLNPGLAMVEMDVADRDGIVVFPKHVFLVAWMNLVAPTITELSDAALAAGSDNQDTGDFGVPAALSAQDTVLPNTDAAGDNVMLGDPAGDGTFLPVTDANGINHLIDGLISVHVTGQFPNGAGGMWTMPNDWEALANQYEADNTSSNGHDVTRWDIHDALSWDPSQALDGTRNHSSASGCGTNGAFDTVDNCTGGTSFSNLFGNSTPPTAGPFDPQFAAETLLSDGVLSSGDAPMPAARIDFNIAAGGVGGFDAVHKSQVYIRDASLSPAIAHNAYAPYYTQWIPATSRSDAASGIDGPAAGNDFQGFLTNGNYVNWDLLNETINNPERLSDANDCKDNLGVNFASPRVPDTVSVYTDEHGEAIVAYNPDRGFFFTANNNGLCDLGDNAAVDATGSSATTPVLLGTSTIQATALYPFKPVAPLTGIPSNTLVKTVMGLPAKFLRCVQKDDRFHAFCVETIRDIYGNPVAGANVDFSVEPQGAKLIPAALKFAGFDTRGQASVVSQESQRAIVRTNDLGQAGVEVISTLGGQVDLLAENLLTRNGGAGIIRDACINFSGAAITASYNGCTGGTGAPAPPAVVTPPVVTPPTSGGTGGSPSGGGSTTGGSPAGGSAATETPATVVSLGGSPTPTKVDLTKPAVSTKKASVKKASLAAARLVVTKKGRYLVVRVKGATKMAKVHIVLINRKGHAVRSVNRYVRTGKLVQVKNLKIAKSVKAVRVSLVR